MILSFMTQKVTVIRPTVIDDRGTPVYDYDNPASTEVVEGCSVQPGANFSTEVRAGRQGVTVRFTVYAPPGLAVSGLDVVELNGTRYSVDGDPAPWPSPTGALENTVISLIDWQG